MPNIESSIVAMYITKTVRCYSNIRVIITDQGCEFCNAVNDAICSRMGIDHCKTTAYHPQSNHQTEWCNGTLRHILVKYINFSQNNWDHFIAPVLMPYRTHSHMSAKQTPFLLAFGKNLTLLVEQDYPVGPEHKVDPEGKDALNNRITTALDLCNSHLKGKDQH